MALIKSFEPMGATANARVHRTEAECRWVVFESGGKRYLQLNTYGSDAREIPGKVSQTIQLDEASGRSLRRLIDRAFPA